MKHLTRISLTILFAIFVVQVNSQGLLKDLKKQTQKKIEQRVEQRANEKIDNEIDKQLDKVEDSLFKEDENNEGTSKSNSSDRSEERITEMMKKMGVGGEPVPIESSYSFDNLVRMHIESFNSKGEKTSEGEFITHLSNDSKSMAYEFVSGDMAAPDLGLIIIDAKNRATIILSEDKGKKTGLVYGLGTFFSTEYEEGMEDIDLEDSPETYLLNPNVEKTGRTKTVAGLHCEEYKHSDENTVSNIWITKDLKLNTKDFFGLLFKTSLYSHGMGWGYMMEGTSVNKESGEKSFLEVTKVDKNSKTKVDMSEYQVTNLGSFAPETEK